MILAIRLLCIIVTMFSLDKLSGQESNSIGMKMIKIPAGQFRMGNDGEINYKEVLKDEPHTPYLGKGSPNPYIKGGPVMNENPLEWDEKPAHTVKLTQSFYMSATPVTNAQYEQFRPEHKLLRGKLGYSKHDDDAVLFVSWDDAVAFAKWLTGKEGTHYRLPTEAEWEYAARAGTTTMYSTGDSLPKVYWQHQVMNRSHSFKPDSVNLGVGMSPPNAWGLFNMHGLVEEWCADWYGPYNAGEHRNPTGARTGYARVTRGGSHSTGLPFLRSANRSGALPGTKSFLIGFRVVKGKPLPATASSPVPVPVWASDINQQKADWKNTKVSSTQPIFKDPKTYTRVDPGSNGPFYFIHNHEPALSVLPNGDLLAIWFTTTLERGREMIVAGARLRKGAKEWDKPYIFFQVPDRNVTGQALWWDGEKTVYHFSGVGVGDTWERLNMIMRTSTDNGVTWSAPQIIGEEFKNRHQVIDAVMRTKKGQIVLLCDADPSSNGGTAIHIRGTAAHISKDKGSSWVDPGLGHPLPVFKEGNIGRWIAGIHAGIVELKDGSWMALGRGDAINGTMPMSISKDEGKTWQYFPTSLTPIQSAQRLALIRLQEGPLLLVSFEQKMTDLISNGEKSKGIGMYAALSYDEGKTWPVRKLVTPGEGERYLDAPCNLRWGKEYSLLRKDHAERRGYLTVDQAPDGMIHLLSSGTHYAFNMAWIQKP
jgi:sulfatase modifying factor 1